MCHNALTCLIRVFPVSAMTPEFADSYHGTFVRSGSQLDVHFFSLSIKTCYKYSKCMTIVRVHLYFAGRFPGAFILKDSRDHTTRVKRQRDIGEEPTRRLDGECFTQEEVVIALGLKKLEHGVTSRITAVTRFLNMFSTVFCATNELWQFCDSFSKSGERQRCTSWKRKMVFFRVVLATCLFKTPPQ